jgi:hypothetical protein
MELGEGLMRLRRLASWIMGKKFMPVAMRPSFRHGLQIAKRVFGADSYSFFSWRPALRYSGGE